MRHLGPYSLPQNAKVDLQTFFSGLYSETFFRDHYTDFFTAANSFWQLNLCLVLRLYFVVLLASIAFDLLIIQYGKMRRWLEKGGSWPKRLALKLLAIFVLPRIAEWHAILSPVLLPSKSLNIEIDILTKGGTLYAGRLADKVLAADGSLQSITLAMPRRFRREDLLKAREANPKVPIEQFWKPIPGQFFVVLASEISTLNIRHIPASVPDFAEKFDDIAGLLQQLKGKLQIIESKGKTSI